MNRIGYKLDAVISGFAIGAGFSVVENILYLTIFPDYGTGTWLVRGLRHGDHARHDARRARRDRARIRRARNARARPPITTSACCGSFRAMRVAVALHTAFNQFPDRPLLAMMGAILVAPIVLIAILSFGTAEAQRWLAAECAEHRAQFEALRARPLAGRPGRARRSRRSPSALDPEAAKRIRRYWELQAWLVAEAEETHDRGSGRRRGCSIAGKSAPPSPSSTA